MDSQARVCSYCGQPPGAGVFCAACGRNLSQVDRLPTRAEWETDPAARASGPAEAPSLADRCAEATAAFLAAMHAAGDPGAAKTAFLGGSLLRRRPRGWIVREVHRRNDDPMHYDY